VALEKWLFNHESRIMEIVLFVGGEEREREREMENYYMKIYG
jgi:hypothetical protein